MNTYPVKEYASEQTREQNKSVVNRLYEQVINNAQVHVIDAIVAEEVTVHDPIMGELHGIDAFRQFIDVFLTGFPQQQTIIHDTVAEGDMVAILHTHNAVNTGSFMGIPPTGRTVSVRGLELFRIVDGKIVDLWRHDDDAGLMRQLGVIPE